MNTSSNPLGRLLSVCWHSGFLPRMNFLSPAWKNGTGKTGLPISTVNFPFRSIGCRIRSTGIWPCGGTGLPVLLIVGLATRLSALGLMVVTAVAWSAVHAGLGYNVCDNGYKMALIYLVVLFPILLQGAGRLSLDALLKKRCCRIKHFL